MKKFYIKALTFAFLFAVAVFLLDCLSMTDAFRVTLAKLTNSYSFLSVNVGAEEIKPYIYKVQSKDDTTKLIIGDSVCHQMFSSLQEYNDTIAIAGSNAAITMAGQYILAEEYIRSHPDATDIFLIAAPTSLETTYDTQWGYQYVVMPFVETDTLYLLDKSTIQCLESVYGKFFMKPAVVDILEKSAVNRKLYLNILKKRSHKYRQTERFEIAEQYIGKPYSLCEENNVTLHLYACPVSEEKKEIIDGMRAEYEKTDLYRYFPDYLKDVVFFPAEQSQDNTHFSGEYRNQEHFNQNIKIIISGKKLEEFLQFG